MMMRLTRVLNATAALLFAVGLPIGAWGAASTNWSVASVSGEWQDDASWTLGHAPISGENVVVTNALVLSEPTAYLKSFTLQNATMTFTNWTTRLWAETVELQSGKLTLPPAFANDQMSNRVWIVCSNLTVATAGTIDVNGKGYAGGDAAHTAGYGPGGGLAQYGGGYGGRGGQSFQGIHWGGDAYGVSNAPVQPGSGGGYTRVVGGAGGGAVLIDAEGTATVYGTITADGLPGTDDDGGGSGGSILINCLRFDGSTSGLLSADGVNGQDTGGGGGGGRIAVNYSEIAQTTRPGVRFTTGFGSGARGRGTGESGTVYLSGTDVFLAETLSDDLFTDVRLFVNDWTNWSPNSLTVEDCSFVIANEGFVLNVANDLRVDSGGHFGLGPYALLTCAGNLVLTNGGDLAVFAGATNGSSQVCGAAVTVAGNMSVGNGSWVYPWSHETNGGSARFTLNNLAVLSGGGFDADQKGFAGGTTAGGYGPGGAPIKNAGAGYGGRGARHYSFAAEFGPVYGSITAPLLPGSGGGGGVGGDGGGLVWIEASGTVAVYGTLSANGGGRTEDRGGGGSGGGIYIDCQRFEGNGGGLLSAAGGINADTGGPGGGGRIAVHVDSNAQAGHRPGVQFMTSAGIPSGRISDTGDNGTVYLSDSSLFRATLLEAGLFQDAFVYADNLAFTNWALDTLTVDDCRFAFGAEGFHLTVTNNVTLRNGADLGIPGGGVLKCDSLMIESAATLSAYGSDTNVTGTYYGSLIQVNGDMQVDGTSWVKPHSHPTLGGSPVFRMRNLMIAAGGGFNADGGGYWGGQSSGVDGYGPGRGLAKLSFGSGGGYGGKGGNLVYDGEKSGGLPYASTNAPAYPGSGAGALGGGDGGGLILIEADGKVVMDGTLSANGNAKRSGVSRPGGGSGGGIFVLCRKFSGGTSAAMRADGGNGGTDRAGGGGGGRIAVWHGVSPNMFSRVIAGEPGLAIAQDVVHAAYLGATPSVTYGTGGGQNGEPGSIGFFQAPPTGTLIILR